MPGDIITIKIPEKWDSINTGKRAASVTLVTEVTGIFPNNRPSFYHADLWLNVPSPGTISASNHSIYNDGSETLINVLENEVREILNAHNTPKEIN